MASLSDCLPDGQEYAVIFHTSLPSLTQSTDSSVQKERHLLSLSALNMKGFCRSVFPLSLSPSFYLSALSLSTPERSGYGGIFATFILLSPLFILPSCERRNLFMMKATKNRRRSSSLLSTLSPSPALSCFFECLVSRIENQAPLIKFTICKFNPHDVSIF